MSEKLTVCFVGCGRFAKHFVGLMKAHPAVEKVYVCDLIPEKAKEYSEKFDVEIIDTFEEVLERKDINAIANFTQRHFHGPVVIKALKAGKHVYSAVPMATEIEECQEIVRLCEEKKLIYMMGETCYYYPCAMFCRERYSKGEFGNFLYGASQYYHHIDSISYGKEEDQRGMPPLFYPTHSTGMILSAVDSYVTRVTGMGTKDSSGDPKFGKGKNQWDNEYTNQYVLMELANGGIARVTESRTFGWNKPSSYISALYGTEGSYEFSNAQHIMVKKNWIDGKENVDLEDVSDYCNPKEMTLHKDEPGFKEKVANGEWQWADPSPVQDAEAARLPKEYDEIVSGHMCSHKFLIDDFCTAASTGKLPPVNAWKAARYTIPGLVAIKSIEQGSVPLDVPDCGEGPKKW